MISSTFNFFKSYEILVYILTVKKHILQKTTKNYIGILWENALFFFFYSKIQYFQASIIWTSFPIEDKNTTWAINKNFFMVSKKFWKTMPGQNLGDPKNIKVKKYLRFWLP